MSDWDAPPIREFADRGTLWLLESPQNLHDLLHLVAAEVADKLDFTKAERINRSFIPDNLQKQEADLLFRVPFRDGKGVVWVYVLLEHQSRPDKAMGLRLLSYMVELWMTQLRAWKDAGTPASQWKLHPIIPLVFYTGKRKWKTPISLKALMEVPALLNRFVPSWETLFLNLAETPSETLENAKTAIGSVLRVLQAADASKEELARVLSEAVTAMEKLPESSRAEWRRAMQFLFLLLHHKREPEEQEELAEDMVESVERLLGEEIGEMARTSAQVLMAQGRREGLEEGRQEGHREGRQEGHREGRQEGRQEGRIEGEQTLLLRLLEAKFGPLSEEGVAKVNELSEAQIIEITKRVFAAQTLAELGL